MPAMAMAMALYGARRIITSPLIDVVVAAATAVVQETKHNRNGKYLL